jgi:hypothetical protein
VILDDPLKVFHHKNTIGNPMVGIIILSQDP